MCLDLVSRVPVIQHKSYYEPCKGKRATTLKKEKGDEDEGKKHLVPITSPLITAKWTALL